MKSTDGPGKKTEDENLPDLSEMARLVVPVARQMLKEKQEQEKVKR